MLRIAGFILLCFIVYLLVAEVKKYRKNTQIRKELEELKLKKEGLSMREDIREVEKEILKREKKLKK